MIFKSQDSSLRLVIFLFFLLQQGDAAAEGM
jgi:hypothetical protein